MALTAHSGFEMGDFGEWGSITGSPTIDDGTLLTPHTGGYHMRCNASAAVVYASVVGGVSTWKRLTVYIHIVGAPNSETVIIGVSGGGDDINVRLTSDRKLKLYHDEVQKGSTGTTQLSLNTWYRISVSVDGDTANDPCKVYINGIEEISADTDGTSNGFMQLGIRTAVTAEIYYDDLVIDDTSSTADLGDIRVELSQPNAVGNYNDFDNLVSSAIHYENVDELPVDDADYNEIEATGTFRDSYGIENSSAIGLGGSDTIKAVSIWARLLRNGGGGTDHMILVRDNGSDFLTADLPLTTSFAWFNKYDADLPNGGGVWTQGRFDAFEVGVYRATAQDMTVSNMQVMVAYIPSDGDPDIANLPTSYNFGTVITGSETVSGLSNFTVTNNSGFPVDITIQGTDMTGGVTWTLSDTASPGTNTVGIKAGLSGGDYTIIVKKTAPYNTLVAGLTDSGTQDWGLKLLAPTVFGDGVTKTGTITITAAAS